MLSTRLPQKRFVAASRVGHTELHLLVIDGDISLIRAHLKKNPGSINSNWQDGGGTPLHLIVANEKQRLACEILNVVIEIEKKEKNSILDLSIVDREGKTLLILAVKARQWEFVKHLLENYPATIKKIINLQDENGRTAAHYAALYGQLDILKLLMNAFADVSVKDKKGLTVSASANEDKSAIRESLWSIEIHPDRSRSALTNAIPAHVDEDTRSCFAEEIIQTAKREAIKHGMQTGDKRIVVNVMAMEKIVLPPDGHILATKENLAILCEYSENFIDPEIEKFFKKLSYDEISVQDHCLRGQVEVRSYLQNEIKMVPGSGRVFHALLIWDQTKIKPDDREITLQVIKRSASLRG